MEISSPITIIFFLFLLATTPSFSSSQGGSESGAIETSSDEVYEIDYRGPETHSSHISPPDHSHGRPWVIHHHHQFKLNPAPKPHKANKVGA